LGNIDPGQHLSLPNFKLAVADTSTPVAGMERIEPIYENTRILVFLKPSKGVSTWEVAGFGNCYFWSHDPDKLEPLRSMAASALAL